LEQSRKEKNLEMTEQITEAKQRLEQALPYIFESFQKAGKEGNPVLFVASQDPTGGGKMLASINDPEQLLKDIAVVIGISYEVSDEQRNKGDAGRFLAKFGLNGH